MTKELMEKAKAAESAEELLALAKENGMALTEEEAKKYYGRLHPDREIADEELDNVSGGCGEEEKKKCPKCGVEMSKSTTRGETDPRLYTIMVSCESCGYVDDVDFEYRPY